MTTHYSAKVRRGQVTLRGLNVPDGTEVQIQVTPGPPPEIRFDPDVEADLEQWFTNGHKEQLVSRAESDADIVRLREEWASRERSGIRSPAEANSPTGPKQHGSDRCAMKW